MTRAPITPPTNVVLHYADGRRVPVDTVYAGWIDGSHVWAVEASGYIHRITVDVLPAQTSVVVVPRTAEL